MADDPSSLVDHNPPTLTNNWIGHSPFMTGHPRYVPADPDNKTPTGPPDPTPSSGSGDGIAGGKPNSLEGPRTGLVKPEMRAYKVSPGSLEDASDAMLVAANTATDTYNDLKQYISDKKSWMFTVQDPSYITGLQYLPTGDPTTVAMYQGFDPHPSWTHDWSVANDTLLLAVADAIYLAGQFLDMVNNAGQFYTQADHHSVMPTMTLRTGATNVS